MKVTYRVRFEDEARTRGRVFLDHENARWWASRNRPDVDYDIVARYENALHAAIAFLLRRREPTVSSRENGVEAETPYDKTSEGKGTPPNSSVGTHRYRPMSASSS
jgi:hypothetical protein